MNQQKKMNTIFVSWLLVLALTGGACYISYLLCGESLSFGLNVTCIFMMFLVTAYGFGGIHRMERMTIAMMKAGDKGDYKDSRYKEYLEGCLQKEGKYLYPAYELYQTEQNENKEKVRQNADHFYKCDISDYINEQLLDEASNSGFNDIAGGTMTGLGILGTFVGLIIGLKGLSADPNEIMESIAPLIGGMKVAFLTSVFGVSASLLFNWYYHHQRSTAESAMEHFLQSFYTYVSPRTDHAYSEELLRYERKQAQLMEEFAVVVARELSVNVAAILPEAVNQAVIPQLTGLTERVEGVIELLAEQQESSIERIVNQFVKHMDKSMANQMSALGNSIREMASVQSQTRSQMRDVSGILKDTTVKFESYVNKLNENQKTGIAQLTQYQKQAEETLGALGRVVTQCEEMEKTLEQLLRNLDSRQELQRRQMEAEEKALSDSLREQRDITKDTADKMLRLVAERSSDLVRVLGSSSKSMITELTDIHTEVKKQQQAQLEQSRQIQQTLNEEQEKRTEQLRQIQEEFAVGMGQLLSGVQREMKSVAETTERAASNVQNSTNTFSNSVENAVYGAEYHIKQVQESMDEVQRQLSSASDSMSNIVTQLQNLSNTNAPWWYRWNNRG